jgi:hypothetical protein
MHRLIACLALISVAGTGYAQSCEVDLAEAVATLSDTCGEVERGETCSPQSDVEVSAEGIIGPSVLHAQGSLPAVLPEQNLVLVALGDVTVMNDASSFEPLLPGDPVAVIPSARINVRAQPSTEAASLGGVEAGATLFADALDPSSEWVRIAWRNSSAWVSRDFVTGNTAALPTLDLDAFAPFEALEIEVGNCGFVLLQPPRVTEMRVRVNGEVLFINNAVVIDAEGERLRVTALDGGARRENGIRIPRGFTAGFKITDEATDWQPPRPMSLAQMEIYAPLTTLPVGLVNEAVTLPEGQYIRPGTS